MAIPALIAMALQVNEMLHRPGWMKVAREMAAACLADSDLRDAGSLQFPLDPKDDEYDFANGGRPRDAVLTPEQTALVIAALHDVNCNGVEKVIAIGDINPKEFYSEQILAWDAYITMFRQKLRWTAICDHVSSLGEYALPWFTLQLRQFELIIAAELAISVGEREPKQPSAQQIDAAQPLRRLLNVYTNGLTDERFDKATNVLQDTSLSSNEKLTKDPRFDSHSPDGFGGSIGRIARCVQASNYERGLVERKP